MSEKNHSLWYRLWDHKSEAEKKRIKSYIPLLLYTFGFAYGVIYLSILNTVNRDKVGTTVKSWFGGDRPEVIAAREREKREVLESFQDLRKKVSGGR